MMRTLNFGLLLLLFVASMSLVQADEAAEVDVCVEPPLIQDLIQFIVPQKSFIAAVISDRMASFEHHFLNSYPVIITRILDLRIEYVSLYEFLEKFGQKTLPLDAVTRTSVTPSSDQLFRFYVSINGMTQYTFATDEKSSMKEEAQPVQKVPFLSGVARVQAAEYNVYVVQMLNGSHSLLVNENGKSWTSYVYQEGDKHPTGLAEVSSTDSQVTYLVLFDTIYGFYTYARPLREAIKLEMNQRHYDNMRLLSCPVNPCEDFKVDAAFVSHKGKKITLMSGLHGYQFDVPATASKIDKRLPGNRVIIRDLVDDMHVENLKRVDAAFTAYDGEGNELVFLFIYNRLIVNRITTGSDRHNEVNIGVTDIKDVFEGVRLVDAAVCFAGSNNDVWIFEADSYHHFWVQASDLDSLDRAVPFFKRDSSGRISDKWPLLPTPIHAGLPSFGSNHSAAKLFYDNWYYEVPLKGGAKVKGPFLIQEHFFLCRDPDYRDTSFRVLGLQSRQSFKEYMSNFQPTVTARSQMRKEQKYGLIALVAFAVLIVLVSVCICVWMWRQAHREKTKGFTATKNKFRYDYD